MNFPNRVTFRLFDSKRGVSASNVAVSLVLYARKKNDYFVGPKITDKNGKVVFEKRECIKEIENSKKIYLMDYSSNLEDCSPKISIKIKPRNEINFAVENMRKLRDIYKDYWDCSEKFLKALQKTDNDRYVSRFYDFSEADLWKEKVLGIEVETKDKV